MATSYYPPQTSDLRWSIVIQTKATGTQNADGSIPNVWNNTYTVFAGVEESQSNEMVRARGMYSELAAIFTVRWFASQADGHCGVNSQMRILYENQVYEILGVENVSSPSRTWIKIYAKKYTDQTTPYN